MPNRFAQFAEQKKGNRFAEFAQPAQEEGPGGLAFLNREIAEAVGGPVDAYNYIVGGVGDVMRQAVGMEAMPEEQKEQFAFPGGSEDVRSVMEAGGVRVAPEEAQPETGAEYIGRGVGEAAGAAIPFGVGAKAAAGTARPLVSRIGQTMTQGMAQQPVRSAAYETAGGAGAGAGGFVASQEYPDDPGMQAIAELTGGLAAVAGPAGLARGAVKTAERLPLTGTAIKGAKAALFPFTEAGAKVRASRRLRELSGDPQAQAQALERESIGGLSPARQTGGERLMALERAVLDKDAALDDQFKTQTAETVGKLKEAIREPAGEMGPEDVRQFIGQRVQYLTGLLDQRVTQAAEAAQQRVSRLEPQMRASESSNIVRDEIETALRDARAQEKGLWGQIPDEAEVPTQNARNAYQRLKQSLSRAQRDDLPDKARRFLDSESNEKLLESDTVKEVHGLYSAMREEGRLARAAGNFNKARIAGDIADSILDDLGARADTATAIGRMFNDARTFSRHLNQTFKQGSVGRVLGYTREGGAAVPPETTLDTTIGRGGTKAAVEADELIEASGGQRGETARAAMEDYLRRRFSDYTMRNGQFNPQRAQGFVTRNDELLDRFPGLKQQMQDAEQAQALSEQTTRTAGARAQRLQDPKQSRAAEFLNAPVEKEIETVLRSKNPRAAIRELKRQVRKDDTGNALKGLKGAFSDYLIRQARTADVDEAGENIISGRKLQNLLNDARTKAAADELYTDAEMDRLSRVVSELRSVETTQRRLPDVGDVMQDTPSTIISLIGRTLAARSGAQAGAGASGASLLTAHFASQRMKSFLANLTNDRAEALIRDAIQDRELFRALLMGADTPASRKKITQRLNAWVAGPGSHLVEDEE